MHASAEFKGSAKELTPKRLFPHTPSTPFPVLIFCPVSVSIVFLIIKIDTLYLKLKKLVYGTLFRPRLKAIEQ